MAATQVTDPRELFMLELSEMLYTERTLADEVLPQLSQEVQNPQLREGIEMHRRQTQQHAGNLERIFQLLGQQPQPQPSPALQGLRQDHDQGAQAIQTQELCDIFDCEAAAKTEHLEIASYRGMIQQAQRMGQPEVQQLLQENCSQEEQALQQLEQMSQQLTQQLSA
jgi:ferritin-like metal-binding protein YciE